jgi:hypothetical protein
MSITRRLSRRRFLSVSGIAAGGLTLPRLAFAQNKKAVHFTLPWVAEGNLQRRVSKLSVPEQRTDPGPDLRLGITSGSTNSARSPGAVQTERPEKGHGPALLSMEANGHFGVESCRPLQNCWLMHSVTHDSRAKANAHQVSQTAIVEPTAAVSGGCGKRKLKFFGR